jgi:hypothetical protein
MYTPMLVKHISTAPFKLEAFLKSRVYIEKMFLDRTCKNDQNFTIWGEMVAIRQLAQARGTTVTKILYWAADACIHQTLNKVTSDHRSKEWTSQSKYWSIISPHDSAEQILQSDEWNTFQNSWVRYAEVWGMFLTDEHNSTFSEHTCFNIHATKK